jgi:hypothetical protein
MDALGYPWASHTQNEANIPECYYPVNSPSNSDAHGEEFGMGSITDSMRTDAATRAIYSELITRSLAYEGQYPPIDLNTKLTLSITETLTLDDALSQFVHNWQWDQPTDRRAWADKMARAVLMQRHHVYLPITIR